jgi:protein deglycase
MKKTAIIVLADGFEEIEAITPIDLMRRADINVLVCGLSSLEVRGSHNVVVKAERLFPPDPELSDALVLPGGPGHKILLNSPVVLAWTEKMFKAEKLCAAICAAPSVFGKAGILAGKKATCFPGTEDKLGDAVFISRPVVVDGNVITSRGAGTAVQFSLEIITYLAGKSAGDAVASSIMYQ